MLPKYIYYGLIISFLVWIVPTPHAVMPAILLELVLLGSIFNILSEGIFVFGFLIFVFFQFYIIIKGKKENLVLGERIALLIALITINTIMIVSGLKGEEKQLMLTAIPFVGFSVTAMIMLVRSHKES